MCSLAFPSQVFVGLGFPYEGPAPIEAISLGCVFLQPRFSASRSSDSNHFYSGKPTTRQVRGGKTPQLCQNAIRFQSRHVGPSDFLPAPLCRSVHRRAPRVDSGPGQRDGGAPGGASHPAHTGGETQRCCSYAVVCARVFDVPRFCGGFFLQVEPFTPREFTCEGMLERVHAYVTHQVPIDTAHLGSPLPSHFIPH